MTDAKDPLKRQHRFYKSVSVETDGEGYSVRLDGRTPKSPKAARLILPTQALAELVASEWDAQGETLNFHIMPATRLAHTALDVVAGARAASVEGVVKFGGSDLLCYFAEHPKGLIHRQEKVWGPLLDWAKDELGLEFLRTHGIVHKTQDPAMLARLTAMVEPLADADLAGLAFAASLFGSVIIALALRAGRIKAEHAMAASRLDEIFQEERWGVDAEAEAKADAMAVEAVMVERWFRALQPAAR